ncbi:RNA-directed DNA polymerase [Burkholderia sp. GbtcB21]|uniref:RNA-directed DNA polymerase n=1 Tax=Burkholderia sp. GbtcB21 TaxID=2824766 RepID=UPI001C2FEB3C|nr:RNA-directed DNA polymerase [Burkholderia sp. GbtcB21]
MGYQAKFDGWKAVALEDLVVAYRKAKADCFFENTFPAAIKFAEYEQDLLENLAKLQKSLLDNNGFDKNKDFLGDFRILPKKLSSKPKDGVDVNGHVHFSSPDRAVDNLFKKCDVVPEFRVIGDFPVESHIISALWINAIGHKFDAGLSDGCYGARLRRIRNDELLDGSEVREFHVSAIGSFAPYFQPYQKWRSDGLGAIRGELEKNRDVIAVSLDLKSYYHFIDPMAITLPELQAELSVNLSTEEREFTAQLARFLSKWAKKASLFSKNIIEGKGGIQGGLAIGLTASRVISNVILHRWDSLVREKIAPIHYGRYVDDMFLVLRDTGVVNNSQDFMRYLQDRMGKDVIFKAGKNGGQVWEIQQGKGVQGGSVIKLQSNKQKLFLLHGRAGIDLLDSIEKEIRQLSSESRLMPSPDQLDDSTAARVLSAAGTVGESADTLRRADGLTIHRLSWSMQLRYVETLARDLPAQEWKEQRDEFYQFGHNHVLRPDTLFTHFSYLPRLLGFAISMNEWQQAEKIVLHAYDSLDKLEGAAPNGAPIIINGMEVKAGCDLWRSVKGTLAWLFVDAAARYYDPSRLFLGTRSPRERRLAKLFLDGIFGSLVEIGDWLKFEFDSGDFNAKAPLVALADLAKIPYKEILRGASAGKLVNKLGVKKDVRVLDKIRQSGLIDVDILKDFIKSTKDSRLASVVAEKRKNESYLPYIFPTRPLTPAEISELAPECVGLRRRDGKSCRHRPSVIWALYTQALRGVWIKPTLAAAEQDNDDQAKFLRKYKYIKIGTGVRKKVTVALTNLKTDNSDWAAMVSNKSNLSRDRYQRISNLVNQAIKLNPRPDYIVFPELSIPLRWVNSISARLSAAGISLIAGTEYRHVGSDGIISEACLVLVDDRLGYNANVRIWQPKLEPAVGEDKELASRYGKKWVCMTSGRSKRKPIYIHNKVNFGVMVCSELQNSKARIKFQGEVDALMVLSWNQDLDTFSALVESSALDVHAYTILVNNRLYGDSRVRSPSKESFLRDIARVRGGDNDFVVAATLDIDGLRAFQSRATRWPQDGDSFKPLPEGYKLATRRRRLPPK